MYEQMAGILSQIFYLRPFIFRYYTDRFVGYRESEDELKMILRSGYEYRPISTYLAFVFFFLQQPLVRLLSPVFIVPRA